MAPCNLGYFDVALLKRGMYHFSLAIRSAGR